MINVIYSEHLQAIIKLPYIKINKYFVSLNMITHKFTIFTQHKYSGVVCMKTN